MAINFSSSINRPTIERVVNPKSAELKESKQLKSNESERVNGLDQTTNPGVIKADENAILALDREHQQQQNSQNPSPGENKTIKDSPDRESIKAISAYQNVAQADKKEQISALVGVDIYV